MMVLIVVVSPNIYPGYFICRIIFGIANQTNSNSPLMLDYIKKESRDKAMSYKSGCVLIGGYLGTVVLLNSVKELPLNISIYIVALFGIITTLPLFILIKERHK